MKEDKLHPLIPFGKTQNSKKIWAYYKHLTKTEEFLNDISKIRKICKIPEKGYAPRNSAPPHEWIYHKKYFNEREKILNKYNLYSGHWWIPLDYFIFYSKLTKPDIFSGELLTLTDINEFWSKESAKHFTSFYPLLIGVNPYASLRDMLDWIRTNYRYINSFQNLEKKKGNRISNYRMRRPEKERRNDYIYKHRKKSLKNIEESLGKLGFDMDQGLISKIISLESKRRKKV